MVRPPKSTEHKQEKARSRQNDYVKRRQEERRQRGLAKLRTDRHNILALIDAEKIDRAVGNALVYQCGLTSLDQVNGCREDSVIRLPLMGKARTAKLKAILAELGLSLSSDPEAPAVPWIDSRFR